MSRAFKNILCVTALLFAQSGTFGMEKTIDPAHEIGESVTITERSQLLSITPEQAKKIKSLRIENQDIDDEFCNFFLSKCCVFDSLYFYNCKIYGCALFWIDHADVLGCVNCNLTSDYASSVLRGISRWDYIETLDLSQNKLGEDAENFYSWMDHSIFGCISVERLILSDNGFSEEWKRKIVSCFGKFTSLVL